ncbi:MAG: metalloregulator ArsR/SmtB family transcription factor [Alphaproteobacteria bacterium]|nr:MAG: metalloregulator ArsR/SmtB family transcription factor [Alphaproteobacteria bacterium]
MDPVVTFSEDELLGALRAVAEPTRLRIFAFCSRADLSVTDLTDLLNQSQPRISRHLKIMCEAGVLERMREGTFAFYRAGTSSIGRELAVRLLSLYQFSVQDSRALESLKQKRHKLAAPLEAQNSEELRKLRPYYPSEKLIDQALIKLLPEDEIEDLLDIGTGMGHMLSLFGPRVTHAMGIDLSRDMLSLARANLMLADLQNCRVQHADMYHLPVDAESFDAVTIHHVLHYAERPAEVIAEAARVLRPDGRLVIVDFIAHDLRKLQDDFGHRWLGFNERELQQWCEDAGLAADAPTIISEPSKQLKVLILNARLKSAGQQKPKKRKFAA